MARLSPRRSHLVLPALVLCAALLVAVPAAIAADAGLIAFQGNRGGDKSIFTVGPDGSGTKRLEPGLQPAISRDGKTIAFVKGVNNGAEIFTMSADGGDVRQVTNNSSTDSEPAFSPNGKQIVFVGDRRNSAAAGEPSHIFIVDVDGSNQRQLTKGQSSVDSEPSFSPDGRRIAFIRGPGEARLVTMTSGGDDLTTLTKHSDPFSGPSSPGYSPNGNRILFGAFDRGNRIYSFDAADGKNLVQLTKGDSEGLEPAYSPDASSIVFRRGTDLFTMDADGSGPSQLTNPSGGSDIHPSWGR